MPWLVLGLALLAGPLVAQTRTGGMVGEVICRDGKPIALPPLARLTGLAHDENVLHEAVHVKQFTIDCVGTRERWLLEPLFRLDLEAEAYCTGMEVYADTAYITRRRGDQLRMLSILWGQSVGFEDVYAALDRWCNR